MQQFGTKEPGHNYPERLSAYALLFDDNSRLLVIRHRGLLFLPGGGVDDGETLEEAVYREVLEEVGWKIQVVRKVGSAGQYAFQPVKRWYVNKISHFFTAKAIDQSGQGIEPDHEPMRVTLSEFADNAAHESHIWAAKLALSGQD
jgi:8-oxo-dGTP diphosphatase